MTTLTNKNGNILTIDGNIATLNGVQINCKIRNSQRPNHVYVSRDGKNPAFAVENTDQANAINYYNANRQNAVAGATLTKQPKNFAHATDYATVEDMLNDAIAPVAVVKMRDQVNARKVSKSTFLLEIDWQIEDLKQKRDALATAWDEFNAKLEDLRIACNKQFLIDRLAKMSKTDLQALAMSMLAK